MKLFGKSKETVVKGAVDLVKDVRGMIDDSKFTAEERARYNIQVAEAAAQFAKDTMAENTERSRTRRSIAIGFVWFFCAVFVVIIVLWKFDPEWSAFVRSLAIDFKLPWAFIAVISFFFGAHLLRSYQAPAKK